MALDPLDGPTATSGMSGMFKALRKYERERGGKESERRRSRSSGVLRQKNKAAGKK